MIQGLNYTNLIYIMWRQWINLLNRI